jgi:hypothetical protein
LEVGLGLKESNRRLPDICISPDLMALDRGTDIQQPWQMSSM